MKNTFKFFVSKAKPFLKRQPQQMHFEGLKPKRRIFKGKFSAHGDARGIAIASAGIGVGAVGVGEGVRRGRRRKNGK